MTTIAPPLLDYSPRDHDAPAPVWHLTWSPVAYPEGLREYANVGALSFAIRPIEGSDSLVTLAIAFDNSDAEYCSEPFESRDAAKAEAETVVLDCRE